VEVLSPVSQKGEAYSSTRVRELILAGKVEEVVELLGRHFNLEGVVVEGARRGRTLGYPTANLQTEKELLPAPGVYAVKVRHGNEILDGVANIGFTPTFEREKQSVEVYIFDFDEDLYGKNLRIYFLSRLREERKFASPTLLVEAIRGDVERARELLAEKKIIEFREYLDCGYLIGDGEDEG
jgi:riboflavin kinase/FMN adenylyltransferase